MDTSFIAIEEVLGRLSVAAVPKKSHLILKRKSSHGRYRALPAHRKAAVQSTFKHPHLLHHIGQVLHAHALHTIKVGKHIARNAKVPHHWLAASREIPKEIGRALVEAPREHKEVLETAAHMLHHASHFARHPLQAWHELSPEHKHNLRTAAWMGAGLGGVGGLGGYYGLGQETGEHLHHLMEAYHAGALHPALVGGTAAALAKLAALHFGKDAVAMGAWRALKHHLYGKTKHSAEAAVNNIDPREMAKWLFGTFISYWAQKIADALAVHAATPDDLIDALYEITQEEKRRGKPYSQAEEKQLLRNLLTHKINAMSMEAITRLRGKNGRNN